MERDSIESEEFPLPSRNAVAKKQHATPRESQCYNYFENHEDSDSTHARTTYGSAMAS